MVFSCQHLGQPIGPMFKGQAVQEELGLVDSREWDQYIVPKHG